MGNLWLRIKVWSKVTLFALLLIYVSAFVYENSGTEVRLWVWRHKEPQTGILLLLLYTFLAAVIVTILVRTTVRTLWQIRQIKHRSRTERLEKEVADMRSKAAMLRSKPAEPGPSVSRPEADPDAAGE
jgi:hypothetical protein